MLQFVLIISSNSSMSTTLHNYQFNVSQLTQRLKLNVIQVLIVFLKRINPHWSQFLVDLCFYIFRFWATIWAYFLLWYLIAHLQKFIQDTMIQSFNCSLTTRLKLNLPQCEIFSARFCFEGKISQLIVGSILRLFTSSCCR